MKEDMTTEDYRQSIEEIERISDNQTFLKYIAGQKNEIETYRDVVLKKFYSTDYKEADALFPKYCSNIESVKNQKIRDYFLAMADIMLEGNIDKLKQLLHITESIPNIDSMLEELRLEYSKQFENCCLKIDDALPRYEGSEFGDALVYDASEQDKAIILHVISGADSEKGVFNYDDPNLDFYNFWNREDLDIERTSCSFCAPKASKSRYFPKKYKERPDIKSCALGFSLRNMKLLGMSEVDLGTEVDLKSNEVSTREQAFFHYYGPLKLEQISSIKYKERAKDHDGHHNELVYGVLRDDGTRIQPDYIVVMKEGDKFLDDPETAIKIQKDFLNHGVILPIVLVDIERWKSREITFEDNDRIIPEEKAQIIESAGTLSQSILNCLDKDRKKYSENGKELINALMQKNYRDYQSSLHERNEDSQELLDTKIEFLIKRMVSSKELFENSYAQSVLKELIGDNNRYESVINDIKIRQFFKEHKIEEQPTKDFTHRDIKRLQMLSEIQGKMMIDAAQNGMIEEDFPVIEKNNAKRWKDVEKMVLHSLKAYLSKEENPERLDDYLSYFGLKSTDIVKKGVNEEGEKTTTINLNKYYEWADIDYEEQGTKAMKLLESEKQGMWIDDYLGQAYRDKEIKRGMLIESYEGLSADYTREEETKIKDNKGSR